MSTFYLPIVGDVMQFGYLMVVICVVAYLVTKPSSM